MKIRMITLVCVFGLALSAGARAAVVAQVNNQQVTDKDVMEALKSFNEGQRRALLGDANTRRQIVTSVIDRTLLEQEAEKQKLEQQKDYKEALESFRKEFLANKVLELNLNGKLSDSAVKKYFDSNKSRYSTDQVHAQHILVADESKAKELMKKAKEPGTDFQELAEKNSKDPSAKNNRGDLGFFGRDRMVPEFTDAAFGAKDGEIIGPVKTAYGYHIIKVIEKKIGKALEFDEVRLRVQNDLRNELVRNYLGKLKEQAKIKVDEKEMDKL